MGFEDSTGASGGADAETTTGAAGSSVGVGVASETSGSVYAISQAQIFNASLDIPSAFLRSARPLRLFAASVRSCSRSFSRCSFSRWLLAAAPRGFCLGADAFVLSSSDSITGELLGDLELVRCRLTSGLVL